MSEQRVLLVEDEPGYARFLREVLSEGGEPHTVTHVGTLEGAVEQLTARTYDIVLLDLGLPDADGTEALTRVTTLAPQTPIVVLSAHSDLDVALESMRLGAQEYLVKGQSEQLLLPRAMRYATERKRFQDVLASARAEAERANAVKDEFLAMLGHELRNPLAPIVTGLALMRRRQHAPVAHELAIVERQVASLVRLVDDLLDVARIARGKMTLERESVDLASIVASSVETVTPLVEERRHTLEVDVPSGVLLVSGDRFRLGQVVANLLTNAAKYTPDCGRITVVGRVVDGAVELRVRDNGSGMTPELIARVFELFEQGGRSLDRAAGGLGLGLAIVRNIVTLHGGTVTATSAGPGKGSEFVVRLPLGEVRGAEADPAAKPGAEVAAKGSCRVLIVDDNEDGAEMLALSLNQMGHTTRTVNDGARALEAAQAFLPDVALLDIGLPGVDGYELARSLRAFFGARTPVLVAVTGYGLPSDRARSREAGFDHHLVKPVDLAGVARLIAAVAARADGAAREG